jgi:diaminopimelate epimerase
VRESGRPSIDGVPFVKVCGSGNDFILIDDREASLAVEPSALAPPICRRALSVGADGLIIVRRSARADVAMLYFNADGSRAFCGNGTRCVARWAHLRAGLPARLSIETDRGVLVATVTGERVEVGMGETSRPRPGLSLAPAGLAGEGTWIETGCPHLVVVVPSLPGEEFEALARPLRRHPDLGAAGANVDFVTVEDPHRLRLRSFERGVEGETLACGTGAVAASLVAAERSLVASPVTCLTRGGGALKVRFSRAGDRFAGVTLEGDARLVYTGTLGADAAD